VLGGLALAVSPATSDGLPVPAVSLSEDRAVIAPFVSTQLSALRTTQDADAVAGTAQEGGAQPAAEPAADTLVVLGLENRLPKKQRQDWRDQRLGLGIRGRLAQMYADSGAFALVEDKDLAPSVREAVGGWWLAERSAETLADLDRLHRETGAAWIAHGSLDEVGVTRDRVSGPVGGRRWAYRVEVRLCLHDAGGDELCDDGEGRSVTRAVGVVFDYRGDELAFDQAGPAEAVDRALVDAFNRLMPRWEATR
jgi:hypothetical protein